MCEDDDRYDYGYDNGYESGYASGRDSQEWYIDDLMGEIANLEVMLANEQERSQRLGIALLATGLPSHFVDAIADGQ